MISGERNYPMIYTLSSCLNCCNSLSHYQAIYSGGKMNNKSQTDNFSDMPVWYFSNAIQ